jgi:small subunit ribosomal protein S14
MAKKCSIARQAKRERLVAKYAAIRKELKAKGDYEGLQKLPRNSSPSRLHSRCGVSGRPRAYMRKFGISRIAFRELALEGKIPGVTKASW